MPLSENDQVNKTAAQLVDTMRTMFKTPEDSRPAHARGQLAKGTFTPTKEAATLSSIQIFQQPSTPVIVRLSSSTGIVNIPDSNPSSLPRGFAVRFVLSEDGHTHYDVIAHAKNGFAVRTGEELLELFQAIPNGTIGEFLANHPHTKEFNEIPSGFPKSFATEHFFGVNAFKFTNQEGKNVYFRYRIVPEGDVEYISQEEAEAKGKDYLYEDLTQRLAELGSSIKFRLLAQIAEEGDVTDDATKVWPESRKLVQLGTIELGQEWASEEGDAREQKRVIFDPVPRQIQGVEASDDPLIDMRAAVYLISGKKRRAASGVA